MERLAGFLVILFFLAVGGCSAYVYKSVWDECRTDHSFFYCWHTVL